MKWEKYHGHAALGVKEGDTEEDEAEPFWLPLLCGMKIPSNLKWPFRATKDNFAKRFGKIKKKFRWN